MSNIEGMYSVYLYKKKAERSETTLRHSIFCGSAVYLIN